MAAIPLGIFPGRLPKALYSGMEASWDRKSPSVGQAQAKQGIPLCFVQETEGGQYLWSWGHRQQGLWRVPLVKQNRHTQGSQAKGTSTSLPAPEQRKVVLLLHDSWGQNWEVRANRTSCSGVGMPHSQGFMQD